MLSAVTAARGTSIIVPTMYSTRTPFFVITSSATRRTFTRAPQLDAVIHERTRLGIVSALAANERLSFVELKSLRAPLKWQPRILMLSDCV